MRTALPAPRSARARAALLTLLLGACSPPPPAGDAGDATAPTDGSGGASCRSDRECSARGQVCDRLRGVCAQCVTQADCAMGQVCMRGSCASVTSCTSSRMCPGQVCDMARGYCVDCVSEVDCPSGQLCRDARCVPRPSPCRSDRDCTGMGLVCDPATMVCVECVRPADCPMGAFCSAENTCQRQVCTPSARTCADATRARECNALGSSFVDTPCTPGTSCLDGACVAGPPDVVSPPDDVVLPPPDVLVPPPDVLEPPIDAFVPPPDGVTPPPDVLIAPDAPPAASCPAPGDARIPRGRPYQVFTLRGTEFLPGGANYTWSITSDALCDQLSLASTGRPAFLINGSYTSSSPGDAITFKPSVAGNYTITVSGTVAGAPARCSFTAPVAGVGLRIELCRAPATDVDLWLHDPRNRNPWGQTTTGDGGIIGSNSDVCTYSNCRGGTFTRLDWGYPALAGSVCNEPGPSGVCNSPRLEEDAISDMDPVEVVAVDQPRAGETFRFGVHNYSGMGTVRPVVRVFCGATLVGTYGGVNVGGRSFGGTPLPDFGGTAGTASGPFWRVADVTYGADGRCTARALAPASGPGTYCIAPLSDRSYDGPCRAVP